SLGAQYMIFRAELEAGFQKLIGTDALKVTVNTFTDDADARQQRDSAVQFLTDDLVKQFFQPSLPLPAPNSALGAMAPSVGLPQGGGRSLAQAKTGVPPVAAAVTRSFLPAG